MRLVTRSDFDGLVCGALLLEAGIIDSWKFAHPKDIQDGLVRINENDCLANVPFVEGCGLWFDHHSSEHERMELEGRYHGERDSESVRLGSDRVSDGSPYRIREMEKILHFQL